MIVLARNKAIKLFVHNVDTNILYYVRTIFKLLLFLGRIYLFAKKKAKHNRLKKSL